MTMSNKQQLDNLTLAIQKWRYKCEDQSILYPLIQDNISYPFSKIFPYSISPNFITIFGFLFTVLSCIICLYVQKLTPFYHILISFNGLMAFLLDAVDGIQGRKWKKDNRDIYVLTQLYDHGFDSLTTFLNYFIIIRVYEFTDSFYLINFYIMLSLTFVLSTYECKVNHKMFFKLYNNPTESVMLNNLLLATSSIIKQYPNILYYSFLIVLIQNYVQNIVFALKYAFTAKFLEEKLESIINIMSYISVYFAYYHLNQQNCALFLIFCSLLHHNMTINYICYEIYRKHCFINNLLLNIPLFALLILCLGKWWSNYTNNILLVLIVIYALIALGNWKYHTQVICKALNIDYFYSIPKKNNNPYMEGLKDKDN